MKIKLNPVKRYWKGKDIFRGVRKYMYTDRKTHLIKRVCSLYFLKFNTYFMLLWPLRLIAETP